MGLKSITLILLALLVLVIPGMLYNNMNNNGLVVSQSQALACSTNSQDPTCQISGNVGCQASSSYCTLSGSSVSIFSGNSLQMFTGIASGSIWTLFGNVNNRQSAIFHGPWDLMGGNNVAQGRMNCIIDDASGKSLTSWYFHQCTDANGDTSNKTIATSAYWDNWNSNLLGSSTRKIHLYQLVTNASIVFTCAWQFQLNYTVGTRNTGYTWYGCSTRDGVGSPKVDRHWAFWVAVPREAGVLNPANKFGTCTGNCYHVNLQYALTDWDAGYCYITSGGNNSPTYQYYASAECNQFYQSINTAYQSGANSFSFGLFSPIILFFIGLAMLLLGLGIGLGWGGEVLGTGTQGSIVINQQGTRLMQTLGLGLVTWVPLSLEFSTWYSSGLLPYGLDGAYGIIGISLLGMFFFGIFWRALSND